MPDIRQFAMARHSKGTAEGEKNERPNHRKLRISKFEKLSTLDAVLAHLFGDLDPV